jgi:hypothetical protein
VSHARAPDFEVRVSLRAADGTVAGPIRLCWDQQPAAAAFLDTLTRLALTAKGCGHTLRIEAPNAVTALLTLTGLGTPHGPIDAGSGGDRIREGEPGKQ